MDAPPNNLSEHGMLWLRLILIVVTIGIWNAARASEPKKPDPARIEFFEKQVRPVLAEHCLSCHGPKKQQAGLRLDTAAGVRQGTDEGPVIVPGDPAKSKLIKSVQRTGDYAMPPNKPLPKAAIDALIKWVEIGAPFPEDRTATSSTPDPKKHWAFQPVRDWAPQSQASNPIDGFIRDKLIQHDLTPAKPADRRTLLRRAYFDLIGLPPTYEQVEAFVADQSATAFEKVVDELLQRPQFGERWARFWLDLARYADTKGYVFTEDRNYPYAYTYRDYVIRALNSDKPYTEFIREQLAADRLNLPDSRKQDLAAMGFLTVGRRFSNNIHDIIDDRIDVVTRGFLGLTYQCARCHDHKFDPVPIGDYYTLYSIFQNSPEPKEYPLIGTVERTPEYLAFEKELQAREEALNTFRTNQLHKRFNGYGAIVGTSVPFTKNPERVLNRADRNEVNRLQKRLDQHRAASQFNPPRAMVLGENSSPAPGHVFLRGNPGNHGPKTRREVPISITQSAPEPFTSGSGRLDLANAIANPRNPLTARVAVNRIWGQLLGQYLVRTPSDFGLRSEPPTHPELLDWLASRFVHEGWSTKKMIRRIMLSQTYQQSAEFSAAQQLKDPENLWLSHAHRKRLDFEATRDSLLSVSGELNLQLYGRSVDLFAKPYTTRRTLYASIDRQNLPGTFRVFDFANPDQHAPNRVITTVPQQALYLMNNALVADQAKALVKKHQLSDDKTPITQRIHRLFQVVLARKATTLELEALGEFLKQAEALKSDSSLSPWEQAAQVLMLSNEFVFVD